MFWIETIGFVGSGFAILTYWMRDMLSLRIAAVTSCIFFIAYAAMIGSYPLILMELILLPVNGYRLLELLRRQRKRATPFRRRPVAELTGETSQSSTEPPPCYRWKNIAPMT